MGNRIKYCCHHGDNDQMQKDMKQVRRKLKMSRLLHSYEKNLDQEQAKDYNHMVQQNKEFQKRRDQNNWQDEVLGTQPLDEFDLSPALESLCYIEEELEASPFTWSEPLIESFSHDLR